MLEGMKSSILLVEDEAIIAMSEAKMLTRHGYMVFTASSGLEAIDIVQGKSIDLILMDIDLGSGLDGPETAEIILKNKKLPILFLSSHIEPEIVARTERITSLGYVVKNSGETVLLASIRMAFKLHEARLQLQTKAQQLESTNTELFETIHNLASLNRTLEETIQERNHTEAKLKLTEEFLQKAQEIGRIGSFVMDISHEDPTKQKWESTKTMDEIFGIGDDFKKTGENWLSLILQRNEVSEYFTNQVYGRKKAFEKEYQIQRPIDKGIRWISGRGELEFDKNMAPLRMIGTVQDITEAKSKNDILSKSLQEKDVLFKELSHRTKNNLQTISSMINIELEEIPNRTGEEILCDLSDRIMSIEKLYELLTKYGSVSAIRLDEYIQLITESLIAAYNHSNFITLERHIRPLACNPDISTTIGMIVNELVSNALKHAFPNDSNGSIVLTIEARDKDCIISVLDTGKALPDDFNIETYSGPGLKIVDIQSKQLGGSLFIRKERPKIFGVCIPLNNPIGQITPSD
jgi:two-component sensor histidine kinase/DNA-binding response OmpR family regulator